MKLTVIGCGDAFGSGGRLQTCFHLAHHGHRFLIDCGVTALIGLDRVGLDTNGIGTIFISHLHGDHFGGLVWWLLHSQHISKRTEPLLVVGPAGIEARFLAATEALFPGAAKVPRRFDLGFREYLPGTALQTGSIAVTAFEVSHPSGAPSCALRFEVGGKVLAFTGDTEWVEAVVSAGNKADLYIMECFAFEGPTRYHLDWRTIELQLPRIAAKQVLLTHMGPSMLAQRHRVTAPGVRIGEDGQIIEF